MPSHPEQSSGFRLVRYFTATSLVAFVIIAAALGYVFRELSIDGLSDAQENANVNLANVFSNELWTNDFGPFVRTMEGKSAAELKAAPQIPELHRKVLALMKGSMTFKVKVYDMQGMTVYSTELKQIGEDKSKDRGVIAAWRGETTSEMSHRDKFSALEGEVQDRNLVETYVPQYDPASGKVVGVFEIYSDVTPFLAEIGEKQWQIVAVVVGLMALLYLALVLIVNFGQQIISRQSKERDRIREALRASEERFRNLVEHSLAGIYIVEDEKLTYANPRFAEMLGYTLDEITGMNSDRFVVAEDLPLMRANQRALLEGQQQSVSYNFRARRKNGMEVVFGVNSVRTLFNGKPAVIGTALDISERKRAQGQIAAYVKQLESSMLGTVHVISHMVELRDPYTSGHERRVGALAKAIGAELGLAQNCCEGLEIIGLVHDLGKIAVAAEILSKPGKLTPIEFEMIQSHAQVGYDILKDVEFLWPLAETILQHHERLDGSGYPRGLKGEQMLLEARIIAVADVVEAMTSHRPYRAAFGLDAALQEIERAKGTVFDAAVVDACVKLFRQGRFAFQA